jgi:hypothetical protein
MPLFRDPIGMRRRTSGGYMDVAIKCLDEALALSMGGDSVEAEGPGQITVGELGLRWMLSGHPGGVQPWSHLRSWVQLNYPRGLSQILATFEFVLPMDPGEPDVPTHQVISLAGTENGMSFLTKRVRQAIPANLIKVDGP